MSRPAGYEATALQVVAPEGIGEIGAGHDLARVIALAAATVDWPDGSRGVSPGDILVITSKVVAKAEGRVRPVSQRDRAEAEDTVAVVAQVPGGPRVVRTRTGLVMAAAGIDASNTDPDSLVMLPADPDRSAADLRTRLEAALGVTPLGVVVSDTMGRPWRLGQTDTAVGAAGVAPLVDLAGSPDAGGRPLSVTAPAVADEIAAAADLVKGKAAGRPLALVRGLGHLVTAGTGPGAAALVRPREEDLFARGSAEAFGDGLAAAVGRRRTVRDYTDDPVPASLIGDAVADAVTAPAPHHSTPWRFVQVRGERRRRLLDAMAHRWAADLAELDGFPPEQIARRVRRGDVLRRAPELVLPFIDMSAGAHDYPDAGRRAHERDLFMLCGGAAVQNLMVSLAARGVGSAWVSSTVFCPDVVRAELALPDTWAPLGAVAIGYAATPPQERATRGVDGFLTVLD